MLGDIPSRGGLGLSNAMGGGQPLITLWDNGLRSFGKVGSLSYDLAVATEGPLNYQGRLTYTVLPGLDVSLLGYRGNPHDALLADRASLFLLYASQGMRFGLEGTKLWDQASGAPNVTNGAYVTAFGVIPLPLVFLPSPKLLLRADQIDPNVDSAIPVFDRRLETLFGVSIEPPRGVVVALDNQNVDRYNSATSKVNYDIVALQTSLSF